MKTVFIDGRSGTTGLRIVERLSGRSDLTLLTIPEELRRDTEQRRKMLNSADIVFLCLPDAAAREAVEMIENPNTVVLDTSTAHRTDPRFAYGFPELSAEHYEKIKGSKRIAVPGCHAGGFIALVYPLIKAGAISPDILLSAHSLTGYSGGGKGMIAEYEGEGRDALLSAPRQYALAQSHKHLPEMCAVTGLKSPPVFCPIVADFYSGMEVTVPLFREWLNPGFDVENIKDIYKKAYTGPIVSYREEASEGGFLSALALSGKDTMQIEVYGNGERILLVARYDNLGKGASGAAVECLNIVLGCDIDTGLSL
ncbi:MAG: N-acetyl-gamma-glutamyl-phosphate reductase [Clostridia bacterium]|nr:N-acetyl-gamma-glutamyl-phosphate reductase [Clostridia bacterium]